MVVLNATRKMSFLGRGECFDRISRSTFSEAFRGRSKPPLGRLESRACLARGELVTGLEIADGRRHEDHAAFGAAADFFKESFELCICLKSGAPRHPGKVEGRILALQEREEITRNLPVSRGGQGEVGPNMNDGSAADDMVLH